MTSIHKYIVLGVFGFLVFIYKMVSLPMSDHKLYSLHVDACNKMIEHEQARAAIEAECPTSPVSIDTKGQTIDKDWICQSNVYRRYMIPLSNTYNDVKSSYKAEYSLSMRYRNIILSNGKTYKCTQ